jgi:hypothetical protein
VSKLLNLGPGKTGKQTLVLTTPASSSILAAGNYFVIVRLTNAGTNPDNSNDGAIVAVVPFTIA